MVLRFRGRMRLRHLAIMTADRTSQLSMAAGPQAVTVEIARICAWRWHATKSKVAEKGSVCLVSAATLL
jgi:hypothetical protein